MNTQMLLVVVTFLTAATLALAENVANPSAKNNATPQLSAATGPSPGALLGQPGPVVNEPGPGDSDDLDKAEFFYGGFGGGWGGSWGGFGNYGRGFYGGYPYGGYYGRYRYGGYPYGGYGGYGW